ncbi:MAG: RNA methyltransferase [Clostridia bacterium]|nr:RNA methyltransferase [Clostridia bacterium]
MRISSKENHLIKQWKQLSNDGKARKKQSLFACEGARLCADAALSGVCINVVLYTEHAAKTYGDRLNAVLAVAKNAYEITPQIASFMADTQSPQGIFCICAMQKRNLSSDDLHTNGKYLALEDVQDPSNLGTIIRTAEALGIDGILLSAGCCDVYSAKVLRGSMGGVFRQQILHTADMGETAVALRKAGMHTYACVPADTATPISRLPLNKGCVCFIGNEGNGLRQSTIDACELSVTIPMAGRAESLNAAMAAGIVLWEMTRPTEG